MEKDIIEMSKELVMELIKIGRIQPEDMRDLLQNVHTTLTQLQAQEAGGGLEPERCQQCGGLEKEHSETFGHLHGVRRGSINSSPLVT